MINKIELKKRKGNTSQPYFLHMTARNGKTLSPSQGYTRSSTAKQIMASWAMLMPDIEFWDSRITKKNKHPVNISRDIYWMAKKKENMKKSSASIKRKY